MHQQTSSGGSAVESLESRVMLSAASIKDKVLRIEGSRRADHIEVSLAGTDSVKVVVNGATSTFPKSKFGKIRVVLGLRDDYAIVGSYANPIDVPCVVDAGDGKDTVYTGAGNDSISGGEGADSLLSYSGKDTVHAGGGNDYVHGGDDNDTLYGDLGNDSVYAGSGDDVAYGSRGDDTMWDGTGKDTVYGNKGDDHYMVNSNRKEFKDRDTGEVCDAEPTYVGGVGTGGSMSYTSGVYSLSQNKLALLVSQLDGTTHVIDDSATASNSGGTLDPDAMHRLLEFTGAGTE